MKNPLFAMLGILVAIAAATGAVIITYDSPGRENEEYLRLSRARTVWHLLNQANNLTNSNRWVEAERVLNRLLRLEPENLSARRMYARVKYEVGDYAEAAQLYRLLIAGSPQDAVLRNNLGQALIRMRWIEAGLKELLNARSLSPGALYIEENLAAAYRMLGDEESAAQYNVSASVTRMEEPLRVEPPDAIRAVTPQKPEENR